MHKSYVDSHLDLLFYNLTLQAKFTLFLVVFFFSWLCWVLVAAHGLSMVAVSRGCSSCGWAPHCGGFSCAAWTLGTWASVAAAHRLSGCSSQALELGLSSCGSWAQLFCSMWDLPVPGIELASPTLQGDC